MGDSGSQHDFFFAHDAFFNIGVERHVYYEGEEGQEVEKEDARIELASNDIELRVSLSKQDFKKLLVAGKAFLENDKPAKFFMVEDDGCTREVFTVGKIGEGKIIPAKEALDGGS